MTKHKFSVGDTVIFINDYGVNFGEKTITECVNNEVRGCTYKYEPTDTPWFDTNESNLFYLNDPKIREKTVCMYSSKPIRKILPPGSVISWGDRVATVIKDEGGREIRVTLEGGEEVWSWKFEGVECKIIKEFDPDEGKIVIEVCERLTDHWFDFHDGGKQKPMYHAQVAGKPEHWGCGKTINEAIGGLINGHPELFNTKVKDIGKLPR